MAKLRSPLVARWKSPPLGVDQSFLLGLPPLILAWRIL